jgi:hypothetical protein
MRGLKRLRSVRVISAGHAFIQNIRRGHYELGVDSDPKRQLPAAFTELTSLSDPGIHRGPVCSHSVNATPRLELHNEDLELDHQ